MKPAFQLSHKQISTDTVNALTQLLEEARAGDLIGDTAILRKIGTHKEIDRAP